MLAALALAGCDADPAMLGGLFDPEVRVVSTTTPDGAWFATPATIAVHDNVVPMGVALVWSESWRYLNPGATDITQSTQQMIWADSALPFTSQGLTEITSSHAIFAGKMSQASWQFSLPPGGSSTVYTTSFSSSTVPWILLPTDCERLDNPACVQYQRRPAPNANKPFTFPYFVGNVNLPAGALVRVSTVLKMHDPNTGGIWGTRTFTKETAYFQADPERIVVPVHMHIFLDNSGRMNHSFMGGLTNSTAGRSSMAHELRKIFDDYLVDVQHTATAADRSSWHREYITRLTRNPLEGNGQNLDTFLESCKVQVQLASVDFIRQGDGLERAEIGYANARSRLPFWTSSNPTMQQHASLMSSYIGAVGQRAGAHVFVVGKVNPGQFVTFDTAGIGWDRFAGSTTPGYALIAGMSSASSTVAGARSTIMHEVGHVLGLDHEGSPDEITALLSNALTPTLCTEVRQAAARLVTAASSGQ